MSKLNTEAELSDAEQDLARQLLESAVIDEPSPQDEDAAWLRFSRAVVQLGQQTSGPDAADLAPATGAPSRMVPVSSALRWLLLGAVLGSAATAAWLTPVRHPRTTVSAASSPSVALASSQPPASLRAVSASPDPSSPPRKLLPIAPVHQHGPSRIPSRSSTLAEEVAQLDATRTALDAGSFAEARRLLAKFAREFPDGELSLEAQVMHIELLCASSDKAGARRAGAAFFEKHANDAHAERVRQLIEAARE